MKGRFEESEEVTVVERNFKIVKHRRKKYRCRCNGGGDRSFPEEAGSRSRRGTEVAAIFYSLLETAKFWKIDPKAYLLAVAKTAVEKPGSVLLPEHYREQLKSQASAAA